MTAVFTPENSEAAAILGGDPNVIHRPENRFGVQIVGGLHQLAYAIAAAGWKPGLCLEIKFNRPIKLPNSAAYIPRANGFEFRHEKTLFTEGEYVDGSLPVEDFEWGSAYQYVLSNEEIPLEKLKVDWRNLSVIPRKAVGTVIPPSELSDLCATVMLQANALVRALTENPAFLPQLYFPGVRENGDTAVLEERLLLRMGDPTKNLNAFAISTAAPRQNPENKRGIIMAARVHGVYSAEMYLTSMPVHAIERMLKQPT